MDCLILRFDAPLVAFGGVAVDQHGVIDRFPGTSALAGLLGNALGYRHEEVAALQALQARIRFSARWDVEPQRTDPDYQTVDLGRDFMVKTGWTTRGRREDREGGTASKETHIRYRHYHAGGLMTIALGLVGDELPTLDNLVVALMEPARPLFLGRKACLPSAPIYVARADAASTRDAVQKRFGGIQDSRIPVAGTAVAACWPVDDGLHGGDQVEVFDMRDWKLQTHTGSRWQVRGLIEVIA